MSQCRSCQADIIWATTKRGRKLPLDPEPDPLNGTVWLDGEQAQVLHGHDLKAAWARHEPLYVPHFASCPDAKQWRRLLPVKRKSAS